MKYVLGIDFGGGASKATLLSENGTIAAVNTVEYPTLYPKIGLTEQDPMDWYYATKENIKKVLEKSKVSSSDIVAVSLDAATHTAVVMDENFNVLRPSIYWTDTRSTFEVSYLKEHYNDLILNKALHNVDTIWTMPQLLWIKNNEPEIWGKTKKILFAKDFVRHQLTGDYVTDYIEAEGSMLFDYNKLCYSEELCEVLGLDTSMLPRIVKPTDIAGEVTKEASEDTGLKEGTPVLCGTTDTVMEVFASGAIREGQMTVKLATAGRICVVTNKSYPNKHLINYSHVIDNLWYPGTATKSCAASYRWYRDTFGEDYKILDEGASKIPAGAEGLMFHPYLNGELTPYADPKLCGSFIGIRAFHNKAHFTRAVLEGVSMSILDCKKALEGIGIPHESEAVIIGGGGQSPLWRKITSDMLGITLIQKKYSDSSFGSAMLAGVAAGIWDSPQSAVSYCNETISKTDPDFGITDIYAKQYTKYKAVHDALAPIYDGE
ncbi:MAG: FGGY family carbohydrate kinase [Bacillota bacterium]|nr:FGGY family carbohydrate kinase [Bacillota bacterium]